MLRRSLVALAAVLLAFTAASCSDSGSAAEFCSLESDKSLENSEDPEDIAQALAKAKDKAPDEIKDDVDVVADAFGEYTEKTEGLDPATDTEAFTAASESISSEKVQKALANIEKFSKENCEKD